MKYEEPAPVTHADAERAFEFGTPNEACDALVGVALHDADWRWVQAWCITLLKSKNVAVKGLAATCLGHLARIHRQLDLEVAAPALAEAFEDVEIQGRVEDALSDIKMFMGVDLLGKAG